MVRKEQGKKEIRPGVVPSWPYSPDAPYWNEGKPWDDMQLHDLIWELNSGDAVEETAVSIQRPPSDIRAKMRELGLKEKDPGAPRAAQK
jgi:hypothetical protein